MNILPDQWATWTDDDVWAIGPEPSEEDATWAAETLNDDWHDLDGHPVIDDDTIDDEAAYWEAEVRRHSADPTDEDIAEADSWTEGDEWDADGHFDDMAAESAFMDAYERGLKLF